MTAQRAAKGHIREVADLLDRSHADIARYVGRFNEVFAREPLLNHGGLGVAYCWIQTGLPLAERRSAVQQLLRENRAALQQPGSVAMIIRVEDWLTANVRPIKTPNRRSYGLKHTVEAELDMYVANGQLITAALMAGYPMKPQTPNPLFAMSLRDLDPIEKAQRLSGRARA